jgi:polyisoprenoid-binding protein YceI
VAHAPARDNGRRLVIALSLISTLVLATGRADSESRRWTTVRGQSSVSFDASFALGDFSGRTEEVQGEFTGDPSDLRHAVSGTVRIKAATLRTGVSGRDRDMWRSLRVDRYPEIRFTINRVEASYPSVTDRSDVLLTVSGVMAIGGIEHAMVFPGRVRLRDGRLWVRGERSLTMSDFAIKAPRRLFFRVSDAVMVRFELLLSES